MEARRSRLFIGVMFAMFAMFACDDRPPPVPVAPDPPAEEIRFPSGAAHAHYVFHDADGVRRVVRDLLDIPAPVRSLTAVSIGEKTAAPEGSVYVLDLGSSDDRVSVAHLVELERVARESAAAWTASDIGMRIWEEAALAAGAERDEPRKMTRASNRKRSKGKGKPSKQASEAIRTIEIVSVSDAEWKTTTGGSDTFVGGSWKPVTFYYTRSCGHCRRARAWMDENGVDYEEHDVGADRNAGRRMSLIAQSKGMSPGAVPTFVIGRERKVMQGWDPRRFEALARR